MEANNIKAAYQIGPYAKLQLEWSAGIYNDGTKDFYTFITTPSPEREKFLGGRSLTVIFIAEVAVSYINN